MCHFKLHYPKGFYSREIETKNIPKIYLYYASSNQAIPLQYVPQVASRSSSPTSISQARWPEKSDRSKRSGWENVEAWSLITAYREIDSPIV